MSPIILLAGGAIALLLLSSKKDGTAPAPKTPAPGPGTTPAGYTPPYTPPPGQTTPAPPAGSNMPIDQAIGVGAIPGSGGDLGPPTGELTTGGESYGGGQGGGGTVTGSGGTEVKTSDIDALLGK